MKKGKVFILSGPSGSGKTTLYKKLLATQKNLVKSISVTTRAQRPGEKHGRDYFFVSKKMFLYKRRAGHFLESEKVFDNYYGTPGKGVGELLKSGKNTLLCIDVKGAKTVCRKFPEAVTIFIKTRTLQELKRRLKGRGSEDKKTVRLRLGVAKEELGEAKHYQYIVVNEDLNIASKELENIVEKEIFDKKRKL
ncbi:Guanylate kinase [hydrothermal vent metagenome]|uniref:Guanylate kinase n=1 Tax=hydrothermal vent metagenome TaxID=652676 RepID=A0A3B1DN14_9ZZZZ